MTREQKEIACKEAPVLVGELIRVATKTESEAVRVAASWEMFDRGFGKATQPVEGSLTYGISEKLAELFKGNEGNTPGVRLRVVPCRHRMASSPTDEDQPSRARSRLLHGAKGATAFGLVGEVCRTRSKGGRTCPDQKREAGRMSAAAG